MSVDEKKGIDKAVIAALLSIIICMIMIVLFVSIYR